MANFQNINYQMRIQNKASGALRGLAQAFTGVDKSAGGAYSRIRKVNQQFYNINKDANRASMGVKGFGNSMLSLKNILSWTGFYMMGRGIFGSIKGSFEAIETANLFSVSLGEVAKESNELLKSMSAISGMDLTNLQSSVGTYALLARSMGMADTQAKVLSENTAKLALDLSSLMNVPIEQVMQDLRSGLVGQSETVYKYGIDVTEAGIKAEAMAQGITKSVRNMSQGEKMALRYSVMLKNTTLAQGDFARTLNQPANQLRILQERFVSLSRAIGNIFTPLMSIILPIANAIIKILIDVANAIAKIVGFKPPEIKPIGGAMKGVADDAERLDDAVGGAGKSAKALKNSLLGIDEINLLPKDTDSSGGGGGGSGVGGDSILDSMNIPSFDNLFDSIKTKSDEIYEKLLKWKTPMMDFGQTVWDVLSNIGKTGMTIGKILSVDLEYGAKIIQSQFVELGTTILGVFKDLSKLNTPLQEWLWGNFVPYMSTAIREVSKRWSILLEDINMIFADLWNIVIFPILNAFVTDGLPLITEFASEAEKALTTFFETADMIFDLLWQDVQVPYMKFLTDAILDLQKILSRFWNEYGKPIFGALKSNMQTTGEIFKSVWVGFLEPMFSAFMNNIDWLWNKHLAPLVENVAGFVADFIILWSVLYREFIKPMVDAFVERFAPPIVATFKIIGDVAGTIFAFIADYVNSFITIFRGLMQFFTGVFTGDWSKAWNGIKNIFIGVWQGMTAPFKAVLNVIIDLLNGVINAFENGMNGVISGILNSKLVKAYNEMAGLFGQKQINVGFRLNIPNIPKLAQGGMISSGQLFEAGEMGKAEMIGSYQGKTTVMPLENTNFVSAIHDAVFSAVKSATSSNSTSNDGGDVILKVGESEFGRIAIDTINNISKQEGKLLLNI
jgi:hypothetical protein